MQRTRGRRHRRVEPRGARYGRQPRARLRAGAARLHRLGGADDRPALPSRATARRGASWPRSRISPSCCRPRCGARPAASRRSSSGFLASAAQAEAVAELVKTVKAERPDALYLCDPVIGDEGELYVGEPLAYAIRDKLMPLADLATPNAFECAWLGGRRGRRHRRARRDRARPAAAGRRRHLDARPDARAARQPARHRRRRIADRASAAEDAGEGDRRSFRLAAARPAACRAKTGRRRRRLAVASTYEVIAGTVKAGADELLLPELQGALADPHARVSVRRLGAR